MNIQTIQPICFDYIFNLTTGINIRKGNQKMLELAHPYLLDYMTNFGTHSIIQILLYINSVIQNLFR